MTKLMLSGEPVSKLLANTLVTIKQEQEWSEKTLMYVIYVMKDQD
jgi:hypothetical protein